MRTDKGRGGLGGRFGKREKEHRGGVPLGQVNLALVERLGEESRKIGKKLRNGKRERLFIVRIYRQRMDKGGKRKP